MTDIRIGQMTTEVEVIDDDALLSPRVMARIVAAVEAALARKADIDAARRAETRIGKGGGAGS
ncbi:MAG: hypothetical protein GW886_05700 [Rhodobacterales bacterium]|nr:hypothetical protein [Rhodobacterales bacterium]